MSEPTPYEQLGVSENASYDEIRAARDRLQQEFEGEELQQSVIESAYDAILMERLKARKEGKIPVPEGIRFPERMPTSSPMPNLPSLGRKLPDWLVNTYLPDQNAKLLATVGSLSLFFFTVIAPRATASVWLPLALIGSFWGIWRKHNKFGRSCLLSLSGFLLGILLSAGIVRLALVAFPAIASTNLPLPGGLSGGDMIANLIILIVMALVTAFLG
ncbi:MAG: CPP1-like family protein [Pseudanabaenaceae cyanobacterium bins.68]|nr:CPP1-like family protein [Pseudanabaenaceae cyanobacterium bins.68]